MKRTAFNDGWTFYRDGSSHGERVTLPHDAMIHAPRSADAPSTGEQGNFEGGTYRYEKSFVAPDAPGRTMLQFGGVYRHAKVTLNGHEVGGCAYGWSPFFVDLTDALLVCLPSVSLTRYIINEYIDKAIALLNLVCSSK